MKVLYMMCNGIGSKLKTSEQEEEDLLNKEKVLEIEKKIEIINAPPSNRPWFECFDVIFFNIVKLNGILNAKDQRV